jgi:subtilisin family serine protease
VRFASKVTLGWRMLTRVLQADCNPVVDIDVMTKTSRRMIVPMVLGVVITTIVAGSPVSAQRTGTVLNATSANAVPDSYLVRLHASADVHHTARRLAGRYGGTVSHVYDTVLRGFALNTTPEKARLLAADPSVATVEQDLVGETTSSRQLSPPSWGLDRIDRRTLPLDFTYRYHTSGTNVRIYIVDTGVRTTHTDFGGRAQFGTETVGTPDTGDCAAGHGSHVAGIAAGTAHGVAKNARVFSVKVVRCPNTAVVSEVLAGVEWVTDHVAANGWRAVANASFRINGDTSTVEDAIEASIAAGIVWVVAAGNDNTNACTASPARVPAAITVAATSINDARWPLSNFGSCVDLFAPGEDIISLSNQSNTGTQPFDGTSMAAPHVAGAAALVLSENPSYTPAQVASTIINGATTGVVTNRGSGSPDRLLHTWKGPVVPLSGNCESRLSRIFCEATSLGSAIATVRWRLNGTHFPDWDNDRFINFGCTSGNSYAVRIDIADAAGRNDVRTANPTCRSGNP